MSRRLPTYAATLALAAAATACIDTTGDDVVELPPMCEVTTDCDHGAGEICDEGVCWGDPPEGVTFAAVLVPPEGRDDLVPSEVPELVIDTNGDVSGLVFAEQVRLSGRIVLVEDTRLSVAAQIRIQRPSRIPGGPVYTRAIVAQPNVGDGDTGFEVRLPVLSDGDAPYQITVTPDDGTLAEPGSLGVPADLAPPIRFEFDGKGDLSDVVVPLGDAAQLKLVSGRVVDAAGRGMAGMKVKAFGRWTPDGSLERASSLATTGEEGFFALLIPLAMEDDVYDIVVRPPPGQSAPTLRKRNLFIPDPAPEGDLGPINIGELAMPSFPAPVRYRIPIKVLAPEGGTVPAEGADVRVTTFLIPPDEADEVTAEYTATGKTDANGDVELELIPGGATNRPYVVDVQPLASSEHGAIHDMPLLVGPPSQAGTTELPPIMLSLRVPVSGVLLTNDGDPVGGATLTAAASPSFLWNLDVDAQTELSGFPFPTVTTGEDGSFILWLDETLLSTPAIYDVDIVPPAQSRAPRWSVNSIELATYLESDNTAAHIGTVRLPAASYARGLVLTSEGEPIADAEVKLFEISTNLDACTAPNSPAPDGECYPPAHLRAVRRSDDSGQAIVVLPDP